ncbi:endonuclease/exonuclease/phosphatase family protein [Streptomyces sp. NPDC055681]
MSVSTAITALLIGTVLTPSQAAAEPPPVPIRQTLKVLHWNMAGAARNDGDGPPVDRLMEKIRELDPDIVTINEVCHSQATFLRDELQDAGIQMSWHFGRASSNWFNTCNGLFGADAWAGNAIFTKAPIGEQKDYWFSGNEIVEERSNETRGFTCLTAYFALAVRTCSVHTDPDNNIARAQTAAIAAKFSSDVDQRPYLLAGDFNAPPDVHQPSMYVPEAGGGGKFYEVGWQQPNMGDATHGEGKLDYIFANKAWFDPSMTGRAIDGGTCSSNDGEDCSDHKMLFGQVVLTDDADGDGTAGGGAGGGGGGWPADLPPQVSAGPNVSADEGGVVTVTGSVSDDSGATPAVSWSYSPGPEVDAGTTCDFSAPHSLKTTFSCTDDGAFTVRLTADDGVNPPVNDSVMVFLRNAPPRLTLTGPDPWQVFRAGSAVSLDADFTDAPNDRHTCRVTWDDGSEESYPAAANSCDRNHTYAKPGMYTIRTSVTDDDGGTATAEVMVIVYDPDAGYVTGGGHFDSPAGALTASPGAAGRAQFTLNPKYLPGDTGPVPGTGKLAFQLDGTDFSFLSRDLEWLVVAETGGTAATGTAEINGQDGYGLVVYTTDDPDRYRLVVWELAKGAYPKDGNVVYDNRRGAGYDLDVADPQPVPDGSVQIHR